MNNHICYIVGAGENYGIDFDPQPHDCVIAADGGLQYLLEENIHTDLIVGDFDSLPENPSCRTETVSLPREKDDTDMVAAIREGWRRGYQIFHVYGGTGGRLDHTLANIQCLADIANRGGRGFLFDKDTVITVIKNGSIRFPSAARGTVSVFCHSETAEGVNETGFKYPLVNAILNNSYPLGISNELTDIPGEISVSKGMLTVIYPKGITEP